MMGSIHGLVVGNASVNVGWRRRSQISSREMVEYSNSGICAIVLVSLFETVGWAEIGSRSLRFGTKGSRLNYVSNVLKVSLIVHAYRYAVSHSLG